MNNLHTIKNPCAVSETTVQCQHCNSIFTTQQINCIDTLLWPEGRQVLDEGVFFHPVCPQCQTQTEIIYPSRYIDKELGISAVLITDIENQNTDELFKLMNRYVKRLALDGIEHRVVGSFYAMAELMRIHQHGLNDRAIQLLKPIIIGNVQSQGFEVWNGFFMDLLQPEGTEQLEDTIYFSAQEDATTVYTEKVYQFFICLTNGDVIPRGINDTAYQMCINILDEKGLADDDGLFHLYDLSWAIDLHNSLQST